MKTWRATFFEGRFFSALLQHISCRHSNCAPQTGQRISSKLLYRLAQELHLLFEIGATVADREVHAQPQALDDAEPPVETLGNQARNLLAREHHLPNQFCSRHRRTSILAR